MPRNLLLHPPFSSLPDLPSVADVYLNPHDGDSLQVAFHAGAEDTFVLAVKTSGAAFEDEGAALAYMLEAVAVRLRLGSRYAVDPFPGELYDVNGNRCGVAVLKRSEGGAQ